MPIVLTGLLKSKRFWIAVFGLIQIIISIYFHVDEKIWQSITVLVGILIAAYTMEDTAAALKSGDKS